MSHAGYTSLSPHPGYPMPEYANGYSTPYSTSAYSCGYTAGAYQQGAPPNGFSQNPCYSMPPPQQDKLSVSSKDDRYVKLLLLFRSKSYGILKHITHFVCLNK